MTQIAKSGRVIAEDGTTVNIADKLGGEHTGEYADIEKYAAFSGRFIAEDGEIINVAKKIGSGGGGSVDLKPLTITIDGTAYKYDGTAAIDITLESAEGEVF